MHPPSMMKRLKITAAADAVSNDQVIFKENWQRHLSYLADINLRLCNWLRVLIIWRPKFIHLLLFSFSGCAHQKVSCS